MYTISFNDYLPNARYDDTPWTSIEVEESNREDVLWTLIETISITPDVDPADPEPRSFTTSHATLEEGFYRVSFLDAAGNTLYFPVIQNVAPVAAEWTPSLQQVANLVVSRTRDTYGNEVGTFNDDTRPTDTQVLGLIAELTGRVVDIIGIDIPESLWQDAAAVTAERVAMQIELDYFPEQVNSDRSPYKQMKAQYDDDIAKLAKQVQILAEGGELESAA